MDDNLKKSVQTKFFFGQNKDNQEQVLTKEAVTSISLGLTSIHNSFNQLKAYTGNIGKIQKAVIAARVVNKKESALEQPSLAPSEAPQSEVSNLFPALARALGELQNSLANLDFSGSSGGSMGGDDGGGAGTGGGSSGGLLSGIGDAVGLERKHFTLRNIAARGVVGIVGGAAGMAYLSFSEDAEAAIPRLPFLSKKKDEPPKSSEVAQQAEKRASERRAQSEQSGSRRVQKQVAQEQQTERLTKTVEKAASRPIQPTQTAAAKPTSNWTDNLSSYISKSVQAAEARSAAIAAGGAGAMMASGEDTTGGSDLTSGSYDMKLAGLLANYEGIRTTAYKDSRGIPTIGIGATYYPPGFRLQGRVQMGQTITEEEAQQIKAAHVEEHRDRLLREVSSSDYSAMPEGVKAALESKVFNYGNLGGTLAQLTRDAVRTRNYRPVSNFFRTTLAAHNGGLNSWRRNDEAALIDTGRSPRARISFGGSPGPGGTEGGTGFTPGASTGPIQRSGEAVRGMGFEQAQAATRQMGIRGTNGNLDSSQLEAIGVGSLKAAPPAARAFKAMRAAAAQQGINLGATDAYRDYATQVRLKREKGRLAAAPGRSNHGWGLAFDIPGLRQGNAAYRWMKANSERFGIYGPLASPSEIWHWEYRGGGSASAAAAPVSQPGAPAPGPTLRTPAGGTINEAAMSSPRGCVCPEPSFIPVPVGGGAPSPTDYLKGQRPAQASRKYNVDTSEDYRVYFNAA